MPKQVEPATSKTIHRELQELVAREIKKLPELLEGCTPSERIRYLLQILPYTTPHVSACTTFFGENNNWE